MKDDNQPKKEYSKPTIRDLDQKAYGIPCLYLEQKEDSRDLGSWDYLL